MICRVLKLITASTVKVFHQLFLYQSIATEKLYIFAFGFDKIVQSARPQIQGKRQPLPLTFRFLRSFTAECFIESNRVQKTKDATFQGLSNATHLIKL